MDNLALVPIQNSLAVDVKRIEIKNKIITRIGELGLDIANYRNSTEFMLLILNLIEHLVVKKDKINKKELAIEILDTVFGLTDIDKTNVGYKIRDICRDTVVTKLLNHYNLNNGLLFYSIVSANPIDIIIGIIATKLGLSKVVVTLIIAFLL